MLHIRPDRFLNERRGNTCYDFDLADFLRQVESAKLYIRIMDMSIDNLAFSAGLDVLSPGSPGGSILALRSAGSDSKKTGMGAEKNLRVTFTVKVFRLPR